MGPCLGLRLLSNTTVRRANARASAQESGRHSKNQLQEEKHKVSALSGAVSLSAAEHPPFALRAVTEGTCCDCARAE